MSRVLLLLEPHENRRLLAEALSAHHEVVVGDAAGDLEQDFDLCIVDGRTLARLREPLGARRAREQPVLLPALLVSSRTDVGMITRQVWRSVDDLLVTPIERLELGARVEVLLRARALSVALRSRAEEAEQAARSRDEVLAIVSHDLRNPLNLVVANASFLLDTTTELAAAQRDQLRMIHRAAGQMNRLIQDLLEVAAVESGGLSVALEREPVEPMVRQACASLEHTAAARSVELSCEFDPGLPEVRADRDRIEQLFGNLIGNALKFTPSGGRVAVRVRRDGEAVHFSVTDTGAGIDAAELPHVFDRFWQAKHSREGGAGLGLAIARGIVSAHGGRLWVESEVGRGSTFHFTLAPASP